MVFSGTIVSFLIYKSIFLSVILCIKNIGCYNVRIYQKMFQIYPIRETSFVIGSITPLHVFNSPDVSIQNKVCLAICISV